MILSYCIPYHKRLDDIKKTLPSIISASNQTSDIEIVILDFNSQDGVGDFVKEVSKYLKKGNTIKYVEIKNQPYYHMAKAKNMAVLSSSGTYSMISCADVFLASETFIKLQEILRDTTVRHIRVVGTRFPGVTVVEKKEFIKSGGFDERFEFYGPEDKDFLLRLERRKVPTKYISSEYFSLIYTDNEKKTANYRLKISKREMSKLMKPIYEENIKNAVLVANLNEKTKQ